MKILGVQKLRLRVNTSSTGFRYLPFLLALHMIPTQTVDMLKRVSSCKEEVLGAFGYRKNISLNLNSPEKFLGKGGGEIQTSQALSGKKVKCCQ